jgi:carboxymethylenebutenolidase
VFIHPTIGSHPAVLIWPDAFGLRPAMRNIGKRIAAEGYSVLVPNPFYRLARAPVFGDASSFNFQNPADMAKLQPLMASVNAPGAGEKDAVAYIAFLDAQPQVNKAKKIGTQGYCMGGPLVVKTAAAVPNRVGAGASFHGGGLVTDKPDSPHLLAPKIKARMKLRCRVERRHAPTGRERQAEGGFAAAKVPAEIEVYPTGPHGWCVPDMPAQNGKPIYSSPMRKSPGSNWWRCCSPDRPRRAASGAALRSGSAKRLSCGLPVPVGIARARGDDDRVRLPHADDPRLKEATPTALALSPLRIRSAKRLTP